MSTCCSALNIQERVNQYGVALFRAELDMIKYSGDVISFHDMP
jgi:hypothetical protein